MNLSDNYQVCCSCGRMIYGKSPGRFYKKDCLCRKCKDELAQRRKKVFDSSIYVTVREKEEYNKEHGTSYTYGQYVSLKEMGKL